MKVTTSTIQLTDLRFHAYHGVLEQERIVGNDYVVQIVLHANIFPTAFWGDDIVGTINYADAYECIEKEFLKPSKLLENVAWRVGKSLMKRFSPVLFKVDVCVEKKNPPINGDVGSASVKISVEA